MEIMGCRLQMLEHAVTGYQESHTPLVGGMLQADGSIAFTASGFSDDLGLYYFIPRIAHVFGTGVKESLDICFISILGLSCILGITGFLFCFRRWEARLLSSSVLLGFVAYLLVWSDVYLIAPALVVGLVPWACYFTRTKSWPYLFLFFGLMAGLLIGYGNFMRMHSGTGILILMSILLTANKERSPTEKGAFIIFLIVGMSIPTIHISRLLHQRNEFLRQQNVDSSFMGDQHPFWHSVYIGLGLLNNGHHIQYDDSCAANKVKDLSPNARYFSREYESLLKGEIYRLWKMDPTFIHETIAAKCGIMLYYFLWFADVGVIAVFFLREKWPKHAAFAAAGAFFACAGILVIPTQVYILGFLARLRSSRRLSSGGFWTDRSLSTSGSCGVRLAVIVLAITSIRGSVRFIKHDFRSRFAWMHQRQLPEDHAFRPGMLAPATTSRHGRETGIMRNCSHLTVRIDACRESRYFPFPGRHPGSARLPVVEPSVAVVVGATAGPTTQLEVGRLGKVLYRRVSSVRHHDGTAGVEPAYADCHSA